MSQESREEEMDQVALSPPKPTIDGDITIIKEKEQDVIAPNDPPLIDDTQLKENITSIKMEENNSGNFESQVMNNKTEKTEPTLELQPSNIIPDEPMETDDIQQVALQTDTHSSAQQTDAHTISQQTDTQSSLQQADTHSDAQQADTNPSVQQTDTHTSLEQTGAHSSEQTDTHSNVEQTDTHVISQDTNNLTSLKQSSCSEPTADTCSSSKYKNDDHKINEETLKNNNTNTEDPIAPSRQPKGSKTTSSFSSIIRTRRTKIEEKPVEDDTSTTTLMETEDISKVKTTTTKSGRGRGSGIRRTITKTPEHKIETSPVVIEGELPKNTSKDSLSPSSSSSGYRVTRATAAAAGLKTGDFLQLPWQQKKRKRVGGGGEESDENESKKTKEDEEEMTTISEEETDEEEDVVLPPPPPPPPSITKPSPRGRGRGRGKRGGGVGRGKIDVPPPSTDEPIEEEESNKKRKTSSDNNDINTTTCTTNATDEINDTPMSTSTSTASTASGGKKKRGRPKRKGKETTPITSPSSPPPSTAAAAAHVKIEKDEDCKQDRNTTNITDTTSNTSNKGKEGENDTINSSNNNDNKKNDENSISNEKDGISSKQPPDSGTPEAPPITSQAPPTNIPVESGYPFPRYSLEDQGYSHNYPPHPLHHSFLPHSYPPFSAPPYHTFMIPTSPHFSPYPPPPQDCLPPPHQPLYFSEDPFNRYPPQSTTVPPPVSVSTTNGTDKASTPSSEPPMTTPTNASHPGTPTISTPVTHTMPIPHPLTYTPSHITPPTHHPGYPPLPPPFGPAMIGNMLAEWNMAAAAHQMSTQAPPTQQPAPPPPPSSKPNKESRFPPPPPIPFIPQEENNSHTPVYRPVSNPVNCPECGRHFKNNKALNGHMRLHGGFDWTKRICRVHPYVMGAGAKKDEDTTTATTNGTGGKSSNDKITKNDSSTDDNGRSTNKHYHKEHKSNHKNNETNKSKDKESSRPIGGGGATLDDLCRAAEELERIERDSVNKPRPSPLVLPHERRITSFSPPYTPPPILSPARSLVLLSGSAASAGPIPTPGKIWPQRKGSDNKGKGGELEEPFEPKINIGSDFQAIIPDCTTNSNNKPIIDKETLVWEPINGLTQEDEDTIDGYLELACSPAVPFGGRNKELALHLLKQVNGSVKEAVRLLVMGKSLLIPGHEMNDYNYTGIKRWSAKERQQFRRAWRVHRKQFNMLQSSVETKSLPDIIEYYYFWKKYCPDEYRGRNRHISDELLSDEEEEALLYPSSTGSNSTNDSNDADTQPLDDSAHLNGTISSASKSSITSSTNKSQNGSDKSLTMSHHKVGGAKGSNSGSGGLSDVVRDISRGFNITQSPLNFGPLPNQEHRCKYPGCNQVYSSIFALNGHIRIHGGSWYPKKFDVENTSDATSTSTSSRNETPVKDNKREEEILRKHQLEIAKTMVTELAQPRSPACSLGTLTPSPKPSPGRGKSSLVKSKKACSSSPADRDGFYPCNRCGRVFQKVKSRSAHMKSHIIKQVH